MTQSRAGKGIRTQKGNPHVEKKGNLQAQRVKERLTKSTSFLMPRRRRGAPPREEMENTQGRLLGEG